jgi:sec-independent protein translocase protein TatB
MLGIGFGELVLILVVAVVVVGPKKLPDLAKTMGKGLREFKKATDGLTSTLHENEAFRDLQGIKSTVRDAVSALKPSGLLDIEVKPVATPASEPLPTPELKKFEAPAAPEPEAAPMLLEPQKPADNLEGRMALMDSIISEHHEAEAPASAAGPAASPEGKPAASASDAAKQAPPKTYV